MDVVASKIEALEDCYPFWQIPYTLIELDREELGENKAFSSKKEDEVLNIVSQVVLDTLDELCLKEDLGMNGSFYHKKLLTIYSLIDYLNILKGELVYCLNDEESYEEFIARKKEEFKLDCIQQNLICEYDLADVYQEIYDAIGIADGGLGAGIGQMTINEDDCNIFTVYKTK
jgi:hypothetical protein